MKGLSWRIILIVAVIIPAVVYVIPTFAPSMWPHNQINLGLDLQGGMHLSLEVQSQKAVESTVERIRNELRGNLRSERIRSVEMTDTGALELAFRLISPEDLPGFKRLIERDHSDLEILSEKEIDGELVVRLGLAGETAKEVRQQAVRQALETIRNRIDEFGVSEPDIRIEGENRIQVQLPGVTDTDRAKELIGRTAMLEFKLLDEDHSSGRALEGDVPPESEILYGSREGVDGREPYLVQKRTLLTGAYLDNARVQIDQQYNEPFVSITFNRQGARIFEQITGENVKKRLAIVLDNRVYSAPVIQERIPGGTARITGNFSVQEARDLAIVLRAGALPAPVEIIEERTVGPSLGQDSIRQGFLSMFVGGVLVLVFMVIYYHVAGVVANVALVLNILLIAAGLAAFQATLTLPGIAGIILTIGMAVDANVIIFERIREELRLGKKVASAIASGFDRAALTIMDANVTTLIAAVVLFQFGTGPVRGFAVTLSLGVLASMFTSLVVCRQILDVIYVSRRMKTLSI